MYICLTVRQCKTSTDSFNFRYCSIEMAAKVIVKDDGPECQIIAGVLEGVKQSFIDSGVDLEVLSQLRELWVSKMRYKKDKEGDALGVRSRNDHTYGLSRCCSAM